MGYITHRRLNFSALATEFLAGTVHHNGNHRQDGNQHQRQPPVHPEQVAEQKNDCHTFAKNHFDRVSRGAGHHGHIKGDTRDQVP